MSWLTRFLRLPKCARHIPHDSKAQTYSSLPSWSFSDVRGQLCRLDDRATGSGCPEKFPIVVILFDAFSANHVHHLGYEKDITPNLDRLAAEGTTFENAFSPAPYTLASIPSLFTGRLPDRHGVTGPAHVLPEEEVTFAEVLSGRGYQTFGALANIQGGRIHNLGQGFEVFEELFRATEGTKKKSKIVSPDVFPEIIKGWHDVRDPERTPLYYLHILQPHMPYDPPAEFRERLVDDSYEGQFKGGMTIEWLTDPRTEGWPIKHW